MTPKESELEIRPEYLEKLERIRKGKYHEFSSIEELRREVESE